MAGTELVGIAVLGQVRVVGVSQNARHVAEGRLRQHQFQTPFGAGFGDAAHAVGVQGFGRGEGRMRAVAEAVLEVEHEVRAAADRQPVREAHVGLDVVDFSRAAGVVHHPDELQIFDFRFSIFD